MGDSLGHAGPMLEDMCALIWMNILYGVDYAAVQQPMNYETSSVMDIVTQVMEFNVGNGYNSVNDNSTPSQVIDVFPSTSPSVKPSFIPTEMHQINPPVGGNDNDLSPFENGVNGLYAGHSFFQPIASNFNAMVMAENSATGGGAFPNHQFDSVMAGGYSGTPSNLWNNQNSRTNIENKLSTGNVDLFGLNTENPDTALEAWSNWIDLALSYNDQTSFMIGQPWPPMGATTNTEEYRETVENGS